MVDQKEIYETYIKPHVKGLFNYAYKITEDYFYAEDLVQETIIKVLEKFDTIRKKKSIKWWLFKTLKNKFLDKHKKSKRLVIIESKTIEDNAMNFNRKRINIEDDFVKEELAREINEVINNLPDIFKEIVILNEIENFKYHEISQILDIPEGTVKSRLSRARKMLEAKLYEIAIREGIITSRRDKAKDDAV
jgi:RNA polymerase sigma-70 factor (ECF subfamily)